VHLPNPLDTENLMTPKYVPPGSDHPPEIIATLRRLSRYGPSTPWDTKVERLLNGLRDPHLYIGRSLADLIPWLLHLKLLQGHAHIIGGTRSGKTSLCIAPLAFQLIARGDASVVVIDLKGDNALYWGAFIEAERAGLPFRWFSIEPGVASYGWNPLTQSHNRKRGVSARAQNLLLSFGLYHGETYGPQYFGVVMLDMILSFLAKFRDIRSFAEFAKYAEEPGSYAATNTDQEDSQLVRMLLRQLATIAPLNVTGDERPELPPEVCRDAIDMVDLLTRKQVLYFSLPSMEEELSAKAIGKLVLYAIVHAAKTVKRTGKAVPVYVFVDEFQQLVAGNLKILLEMARSMGVYLILSHQDMSQLKTPGFDITSTVESSTTLKVVLEASSLAALKDMEQYSGEVREPLLSWAQRVFPGLDVNDSAAFSPDRAYPLHDFQPALANVAERERYRLTRNEILALSAHPLRGFVRSRSDSGLTQYAGQWTAIECEFPTTAEEYEARSNTPWPTEHPSCVTVPEGEDDEDDDDGFAPVLPNNPLPVPPPSRAVDIAIAERLKALQDTIRLRHPQPPAGS
jgi:hypothetical protein